MFIKSDLKNLNVRLLKKLNSNVKLKYNFKKEELMNNYNQFLACKIIQRNFRKHFYRNAVDNITLESVNYPCFVYRVKTNLFFYEYNSIIKYIMKSGKVIDPNTRIEYTDAELIRLDTQAKIHFPDKNFKSTLKIKKNENYAKRIKNRENEILTFQMRLDELKTMILTIIEDNIMSWNLQGSLIIENVEYTNINSYINTLTHELKILFLHLKGYDTFEAKCFKDTFLSEIDNLNFFFNIISNL